MTSTTRQVEVPARQTQYTLPRKFLQGSKLHLYLAVKEPEMIQANKLEYTLFVVSIDFFREIMSLGRRMCVHTDTLFYLAHVIEKPNLRIPNP